MENIKTKIQLHQQWLHGTGGKQLDIAHEEFNDLSLKDEDMNTAVFSNTKFISGTFSNLNLGGSSFFNCTFSSINFEHSFLRKCEFHECTFINCVFLENEITKAEFYDTVIESCTFNKVKLGWSYFGNCCLSDTAFESAELDGLMFIDSKFKAVNFKNAKFNTTYPVKINDNAHITTIDQLNTVIKNY